MSDLIKREAAIEVIKGNNYGYPGDYTEVNGNAAIDDMMSLPSAERKGEWIKSETDGFICSACGSGYRDQPTCMGKPMFEYCPFCGARMKGTGDE